MSQQDTQELVRRLRVKGIEMTPSEVQDWLDTHKLVDMQEPCPVGKVVLAWLMELIE